MKRFLSLLLAVIMCVSMVPMTLIDALAHGRGVAANNIENQSLTNMSQLPEQVDVDGKTNDSAWDDLKWNVVDKTTGTWDVKDPLNYDYAYKYQLRKDGEYFYGVIVLAKKDATVKVLINDGTNDNAGYTDYLQFDVKSSGAYTTAHSFADAEGTLPAEEYKDAVAINDQGRIVIEFRTLIKSFSESSDLSCFVSSSVEGVESAETLYYPRVPYTNGNHDVPTQSHWPENSIKVDLFDITSEGRNNAQNLLPSPIEIDAQYKESMWVELSNYYSYSDGIRNQYDFKYGDADTNPLAYKPVSLDGYYSKYHYTNDSSYTTDSSGQLKFKYSYLYDANYLYFSAVVYNRDTTSSAPYLYLYTHYGEYTGSLPAADADNTIVLHSNDEAWFYSGSRTSQPDEWTGTPSYDDGLAFGQNVFYADGDVWGYEMQIPLKALRGAGFDSLSYIVKVVDHDGGGERAIASQGGFGGAYSYHQYAASIPFEGIANSGNLGSNNLGGYTGGMFNDRGFLNLIASDSAVNPGLRGAVSTSGSAGKGQQIYAEMNVDYDYLYGAVMVNTQSFWPSEGYRKPDAQGGYGDMIRLYIKNGKAYTERELAGSTIGSHDGYLSFYLDKDYNARVAWTDKAGNTIEDVLSADIEMRQLSQPDGGGHFVPLEFRIPLRVLGITVSTDEDASGTIFSWYASVESQADGGTAGLVYPRPASYDYFYESDPNVDDSIQVVGVFYPQYWHAGFDKEVTYKNNLVDTITLDGKLEESFWDNLDDMITVSQYNGIWEKEPEGNVAFTYDYRIYNAPDHIYGAAIVDFPVNAETTKFKFWTKREGASPRNVTVYVDESGEAHAHINVNGSDTHITNSDSIRVMATSINDRSVIEFSLKNDRNNLGEYVYAVSVTHIAEDGEELTLFHLGDKEDWTPLWLTNYNADASSSNGGGIIYNKSDLETAYKNSDWWDYYLFAPAEGFGEGVYEVLGSSFGVDHDVTGTAGASVADLFADAGVSAIPEGGFVYCLHTGNNYSIDYTSSNTFNGYVQYRKDFTKGAKIYFEEVDLENFEKIEKLSDDGTLHYEDGYFNTAKYKVYTGAEDCGNDNIPSATVWHENAEKVESLGFYNRETIEVDGYLGDSGWDEDRWIDVNRYLNASYQTTDYRGADDADFRYQMRTDGKYVYVAAEIFTDIAGQVTGPSSDSETVTKLTDLPSFRIWIRGDDDTDSSLTFTHLYDISIQEYGLASERTITGVHTTYYEGEDGSKVESAAHSDFVYDSSAQTLFPTSMGISANNTDLYPALRFAKTNDNGWTMPSGGNNKAIVGTDGGVGYYRTVDNFFQYGISSLYGYTEKIEENTVSGLVEKNEWHSKPVTEKVTFGNEHGSIRYDADETTTYVEFRISLEEIDKDGSGFEYFVHAATSGYSSTNPYTIFYPTVAHEPLSNNIFMMHNLPYWKWYNENSYKVDADEYAYMMLRDSYGPVTTLGAKIIDKYKTTDKDGNEVITNAIRFGAYYNEDFIRWPSNVKNASDDPSTGLDADKDGVLNYWDIAEVGMLIAPTMVIPDNTGLTHETTLLLNQKVLDAVADPVTNWVEGSNLADYETMVYHVPVKNVPKDMKFTFVPYVDYYNANGTETYYGIAAERSYNYVLNALGGSVDAAKVSPFWITHMNAPEEYEGSGTIFTTPYSDFDWGLHIAFAPTEIDGIYEIVAIDDGTTGGSAGHASPLAIPDGGFVWAAAYGNDYPALYEEDPVNNAWCKDKPDYETEGAKAAIDLAREWVVGDTIAFYGWTPGDGYNIPTTTPTLEWYDDNYVCTATVEKVVILPDEESSEEPSEEPSVEESSEEETSEEESSEEPYDENVIVYVPIDDRPVNYDRELYQAEAAGFTILTPDHEDLKTYLNKVDVDAGDAAATAVTVTRYNSQIWTSENVIYTDSTKYAADTSAWSIHVALAPTSTANVYEVTEIEDNAGTRKHVSSIPSNGFVWVCNDGNTVPVQLAKSWNVGDEIRFGNLNLSSQTTSITVQKLGEPATDESRIGNRENIINWLEGIYTNGATVNGQTVKPKYYVLSTDMLLSGGLVGSRAFAFLDEYDPNYTLENRALDLVKTIAQDDKTHVVAFDTIMRLATTGNFLDHSQSVYDETREQGGIQRPILTGSALTLENIKNNWLINGTNGSTITYNLTQAQIDDYFASRERKLVLATRLIEELGPHLDYLFLGTDDSKPQETVQSNEKRYLDRLIVNAGLEATVTTLPATDELGILSIAKVASDRYTAEQKVPVNLHFIDGDDSIAYEKNPSDDYDIGNYEETVISHILGAGAVIMEEQNNSYLQILVVPRTTAYKDFWVDTDAEKAAQNKAVRLCLDQLQYNLANNIPTVLLNAIGGNGQNTYFLNGAATDGTNFLDMDLMKLYGFSQWNTVANATGIAIGNGVSRYAYLKSDEAVTDKSNVAFIKAMATAYAKDLAYIANGRADAYNHYYAIRNDIEDKIENAPYFTEFGVLGTTPSVIVIGDYERLENWDHRDFEAQIPVIVNGHNDAYNADYTDLILNDRDSSRGTKDSEYGYNQYTGKLTDGYVYTNVNSEYMDKWYAFRTDYDDVYNTSGTIIGDGKIGTNDSVWLNTVDSVGTIEIDLGSVRDIDLVRIFYCDAASNASKLMLAPESMRVLVSEDKSTWTEVADICDYSEQGVAATPFYEDGSFWVTSSLGEETTARYVRVEVVVPYLQGIHSWIGEIQVWNEPEV